LHDDVLPYNRPHFPDPLHAHQPLIANEIFVTVNVSLG
jgi:hypothetical protein